MKRPSVLIQRLFILSLALTTSQQGMHGQEALSRVTTTMKQKGRLATKNSRKLFPIDQNTALIDIDGKVVLRGSQPSLQQEARRVSPTLRAFGDDEEFIRITFGEFSEGLSVVGWSLCPQCRNPFWVNGIVDEAGTMVVRPDSSWTRFGTFHEGLARYLHRGWGFIDREGNIVIPARFYEASDFSEGLASVRTEAGKFGFINRTGKLVIPFRFDWASDFHDGLAAVKLRGKYGFVDKTGKLIFRSQAWRETTDFSEGLAAVRVEVTDNSVYIGYKEERYGYIDRTGKTVISPRFYRAHNFSNGRALFFQAGQHYGYGFIDTKGEVVISPQFAEGKGFSEGLAAVAIRSSDDKKVWGYIDREGKWLIKPQFRHVSSFSGGLAAVNCDEYDRDCETYIDTNGKIVWQSSNPSGKR